MSTERSDRAYGYWREASEKFDYFITGLTGALAAFIGQSLRPARVGLNAPSLELLALILFVASAVLGFKRIEANVTLLRMQARRLYGEEARGAMLEAAVRGPSFNAATGDVFVPGQLVHMAEAHRTGVVRLAATLDGVAQQSAAYYRWRNRALLAGFVLLVLARIAPAYRAVPTPATPATSNGAAPTAPGR